MARRPTGAQLGVAAVAGTLLLVWLIGLAWFRPWIAHNDFAIFRIALERELDGHVRLVGAHSRLDVFHPGPLREWVFALPYWISGRRAAALPATSLVLNAGWAIWLVVIARRFRPGAWGATCALGLLVLVIALGADLASPWNPHLAILPMYLACWSTVSVLSGRSRAWVGAVVGASFAAQLHASALVLGGALLVTVLVASAVRRSWASTAGALVLGVVLWSGPIVDLRNGSDANIIRLATVGADGESVGVGDAVGHVSRLTWPGTPLGRVTVRPSVEELTGFHRWWLLLIVAALAGATWWSVRRYRSARAEKATGGDHGDHDDDGDDGELLPWAAGAAAMGVVLISVVTASLFVEPAYRYLYGPLQAGAVFVLSVVVGLVAAPIQQGAGWVIPGWVVPVAIPACLAIVFVGVPRLDDASETRGTLEVERAVGSALDARPGWRTIEAIPLDLRGAGDLDAEVLDVALRNGIDARSRRSQLGLPAPVAVDGAFAVAMAPALDCLLSARGVEEIVRGTTESGEHFSVVVVDRESAAYDRCIGAPDG